MMNRKEKEIDPCAALVVMLILDMYLNTPEKLKHMRNLAQAVHANNKVIADLRKKVDRVMKAECDG